MEKEKQNKKREPSNNKAETMVKIRINPDRPIPGVGEAGAVVEVSKLVADNFVGQRLARIIEKGEINDG